MTATEKLRALLDERGVEYDESAQGDTTFFQFDYCDSCGDYLHTIAITGACISAYSDYITPEQAIAATLGSGECEIVGHYEASTRGEVGRERVKLSCGHIVERHSKYCQECGCKIRKAVER